jgi:hypothetical protein
MRNIINLALLTAVATSSITAGKEEKKILKDYPE